MDDEGVTWSPAIRFRYRVGEHTYTSDKVFLVDEWSGLRGWAQSISDRYRPEQSTTAYYNPADPTDAILTRRYSFVPYFFILLPMAMEVILIASIARTVFHMAPPRNAPYGAPAVRRAGALESAYRMAGTPRENGLLRKPDLRQGCGGCRRQCAAKRSTDRRVARSKPGPQPPIGG